MLYTIHKSHKYSDSELYGNIANTTYIKHVSAQPGTHWTRHISVITDSKGCRSYTHGNQPSYTHHT